MLKKKLRNSLKNISNKQYSEFIHLSRYARWLPEKNRRETWEETVERYFNFFQSNFDSASVGALNECKEAVLTLEVMPSMRALMTAGKALERDNIAGYNCFYRAIKHPNRFSEAMYILMCGTGVGFSVERQYVSQLPTIAEEFHDTDTTITVADSKLGWAKAFRELIGLLYSGQIPKWDVSKVRPAGSPLKTFGGRASGPEPLVDLFKFTIEVFRNAAGRKLTSIEAHDIMCKIADIVVVGGVRRSALISLSNLTDERMRVAKSGAWWEDNGQRALANNSVCYTETPDVGIFMREWQSLYESKSGERGIFNRQASINVAERNGRRDSTQDFGTNPCSEIILRDGQFCNLTEVVVRPGDTLEDLTRKVKIATILGTIQSTLTDFKFIGKDITRNTEEERLLGVSLTGIMDHPVLSGKTKSWNVSGTGSLPKTLEEVLQELKGVAIETNKEWAQRLGIEQSAAITCVKPSGTVSQLVDSASGIHPRYSKFYIRTVRADKKDPLAQLMVANNFPVEDDVTKPEHNYVFSFPMKSPPDSVMRNDRTAIEQLELWKIYAEHWCEHKPSITVYVKEDEWVEVAAWVYKNFDILSGVSFLPYSGGSYRQAPYQEITEEEYNKLKASMPSEEEVDWSKLEEFEDEDNTTGSQTMACTGGTCELVDLTKDEE